MYNESDEYTTKFCWHFSGSTGLGCDSYRQVVKLIVQCMRIRATASGRLLARPTASPVLCMRLAKDRQGFCTVQYAEASATRYSVESEPMDESLAYGFVEMHVRGGFRQNSVVPSFLYRHLKQCRT